MNEKSSNQHKAKKGLKIALIVMGSTLGLFVTSLFALDLLISRSLGYSTPHPTDEALIQSLTENRDLFERLIVMIEEDDQMSVVDPTWQRPKDTLTPERLDEYNGLFKKLKIQRGIRRWKKGTIEFVNSSKGLAIDGTSKGLIYKPKKPEPLFDSLDQRPEDLERNIAGYRKIDDNWYIVRQDG